MCVSCRKILTYVFFSEKYPLEVRKMRQTQSCKWIVFKVRNTFHHLGTDHSNSNNMLLALFLTLIVSILSPAIAFESTCSQPPANNHINITITLIVASLVLHVVSVMLLICACQRRHRKPVDQSASSGSVSAGASKGLRLATESRGVHEG